MDNTDQNEKMPFLDEAEIKRQIELQKQIESKRLEDEQKLKEQIDREKHSLLNLLVQQTEARTPQKSKRRSEKDEELKRYLTSVGVTSVSEQNKIISDLRQPYVPHFQYGKDYYKEIFRLNAWAEEDYKKFAKPREVAVWTVRLIYGRFMKECPTIMNELRAKNKYIGYCIRPYKFFQFLTPSAQSRLDIFIDECITMMKKYSDWADFEKDYCSLYELPYQQRFF